MIGCLVIDHQRQSFRSPVGHALPAPAQPPGTNPGGTGIDEHDPLAGSPLPVNGTGNRLSPRMGVSTAENSPASLTRPFLSSDLLTRIKCKA